MLESRLFVVRCCVRWLLVGAAVTYSALAPALGLGEITVHSALKQPLRADIALVDATGLEEGELSVSLATVDEFSRAGVERVLFLNDLKFTPVLQGNRSLIQVTSNKPVNEPFLNFLVQLNRPNGRLLREYTVLIDPPGSPGIAPTRDEPLTNAPSSALPSVQPSVAQKKPLAKPAVEQPAQANDPLAEQLAASVLQARQLQATIDELNAKLRAQDEQIAGEKEQVTELQTRLAEIQQTAAKPVAQTVAAPAPLVVEEPQSNGLLIGGLPTLVALVLLGWFVRRRRQQVQTLPEPSLKHEPLLSRAAEPPMPTSALLQDIRARHPKLSPVTPVAVAATATAPMAAAPGDEFQLTLDDLSMDTSWDLIEPLETLPSVAQPSSEPALPEPEIEWRIEPASRSD